MSEFNSNEQKVFIIKQFFEDAKNITLEESAEEKISKIFELMDRFNLSLEDIGKTINDFVELFNDCVRIQTELATKQKPEERSYKKTLTLMFQSARAGEQSKTAEKLVNETARAKMIKRLTDLIGWVTTPISEDIKNPPSRKWFQDNTYKYQKYLKEILNKISNVATFYKKAIDNFEFFDVKDHELANTTKEDFIDDYQEIIHELLKILTNTIDEIGYTARMENYYEVVKKVESTLTYSPGFSDNLAIMEEICKTNRMTILKLIAKAEETVYKIMRKEDVTKKEYEEKSSEIFMILEELEKIKGDKTWQHYSVEEDRIAVLKKTAYTLIASGNLSKINSSAEDDLVDIDAVIDLKSYMEKYGINFGQLFIPFSREDFFNLLELALEEEAKAKYLEKYNPLTASVRASVIFGILRSFDLTYSKHFPDGNFISRQWFLENREVYVGFLIEIFKLLQKHSLSSGFDDIGNEEKCGEYASQLSKEDQGFWELSKGATKTRFHNLELLARMLDTHSKMQILNKFVANPQEVSIEDVKAALPALDNAVDCKKLGYQTKSINRTKKLVNSNLQNAS